MNILHVSTARTWRGGEQQIAYLIEELEQQGIWQTVVCARKSKMENYCRDKEIRYEAIDKNAAIDFCFAKKLKKVAVDTKAEILHLHDSHAHTAALLSSLFYGNKTPFVLSRRVDFPTGSSWFSKFKYNYSSIKKIICVSDEVKRIMASSLKDKTKLITIYSGVDLGRFQKGNTILRDTYHIPKDELLIGNVAAMAPHKDYPTFLKTVQQLKEQIKAKYFIIGDGPIRKEIEHTITELKLEDDIIMAGFRDDIHLILPELDVFLITSKTEGLGTSILDAFISEVPVVATEAGGIPELVKDEETGLLAAVGDYKKLAEQVLRIVTDKKLAGLIRINAKKKAAQFSKREMAEKTLEVYREILVSQINS